MRHLLLGCLMVVSVTGCVGFDRARWARGAGGFDTENPRASMITEVCRAVAAGDERHRVVSLLGPPDLDLEKSDAYYLGLRRFFAETHELHVYYSEQETVVRVEIQYPQQAVACEFWN